MVQAPDWVVNPGFDYTFPIGSSRPGLNGWAEVGCCTERGRSVWLRLAWRPRL